MKPGVCTPPPVMLASSPKVMPVGVIPLYSRLTMTRPFASGMMPQIHSKQPQDVIGSSSSEYSVTFSSAPCEYCLTASLTSS